MMGTIILLVLAFILGVGFAGSNQSTQHRSKRSVRRSSGSRTTKDSPPPVPQISMDKGFSTKSAQTIVPDFDFHDDYLEAHEPLDGFYDIDVPDYAACTDDEKEVFYGDY